MSLLPIRCFAPLCAILLLAGCESAPPAQTSLEMQAYQSRDFAVSKQQLFDATMSVLQDAGYIVESADLNTGFITAAAPTKARLDIMWGAMNEGAKVTATLSAKGPSASHLRFVFVTRAQRKSAWNLSQDVIQENAVTDPQIYQNAFTKIGEALFVAKAQR